MKKVMILAVLSLTGAFAHASTGGLCEETAIQLALRTAPGIDESSPASLTVIKLLTTESIGTVEKVEKYYIQTEDQGGTAASIISVKVVQSTDWNTEVLRIKCNVVAQTWVE